MAAKLKWMTVDGVGEKGDGEVVTCEEGDDAPGSGWVVFIGH